MSRDIRTGRHCTFDLHVHLVFVTKYRRKVFTQQIIAHLKILFEKICQDFEAQLIGIDGEIDHVHLLINYPPKMAISKLVNSLKGASSRVLRKQNYPSIQKALWGESLWSRSYFAGSCGGASVEMIRKYIENQTTPV